MRYHVLLLVLVAACSNPTPGSHNPPAPINVFPGDMLAGAIPVFPVINMRADSASATNDGFSLEQPARDRVDSTLHAVLSRRYPTVKWMTPVELKNAASKAPGMLPDPYQVPTLPLSTHALTSIPNPLLAQLRGLTAVSSGGRYILVPANLWLTRQGSVTRANLVITLADVRIGAVSWSGTISGIGTDPWTAINEAIVGITNIRER